MRHKIAFAALALAGAALAGAAAAAPTVDVTIGANLQKKAAKYGQRELTYLSQDLAKSVQSAARRNGGASLDGARFNLVISDAKPNHPTFEQLGDTIGLSPLSISIGGATLEGSVTYPDGRVVPVKYSWYDHDIREALGSTTWTGAQRAFDFFAYKVARDGTATTR
jgi:hypothetical protein